VFFTCPFDFALQAKKHRWSRRSALLLALCTLALTACLGPMNPNYVDEIGAGKRSLSLYAATTAPQTSGVCSSPKDGLKLLQSTSSGTDGKFSFGPIATGCYRVVDTTSRGTPPNVLPTNDPLLAASSAAWINRLHEKLELHGRSTVKDSGGVYLVRICSVEGGHYNALACRQ
jgi:hypothetical protein